jgi:hypothetical protein
MTVLATDDIDEVPAALDPLLFGCSIVRRVRRDRESKDGRRRGRTNDPFHGFLRYPLPREKS